MVADRLLIMQGDLTQQAVDAIVNAANASLLGGGGVDGAIHRAAGPELLAACRQLNGCKTGEAKITDGYNLPAKWVIHTVGPVWQGGQQGEPQQLTRCYQNALSLAAQQGCKTVAFPAISAGVYGYPLAQAARIAIATVKNFLINHPLPEQVSLVCFSDRAYQQYQAVAAEILAGD